MTIAARSIGIGLILSLTGVSIPVLAAPPPATPPGVSECKSIPRKCNAWAPKGPNTCRTCQQALCKIENGKEVLAGNKRQTECFEGHGTPPPDPPRQSKPVKPAPGQSSSLNPQPLPPKAQAPGGIMRRGLDEDPTPPGETKAAP